ncbi:Concanavalin A-like lectin/glucanase, subgroup [Phytophthora cinnamomi]|uniref:Concanavalin A-like lectin/glucanase, subgroup n=1 Tax=Phytophthora cinnamomi TaxID=4785 RepID=UPI0035594EA0|nr:Concanavalin A-like lectin/glucanase, subgroup [Phytophthora cinnamomi]
MGSIGNRAADSLSLPRSLAWRKASTKLKPKPRQPRPGQAYSLYIPTAHNAKSLSQFKAGSMRAWALAALAASAALASWTPVDAAACAEICYTTELTGFGPGGTAGCSCSGSGATRTGSGSCSCGQCYDETNGVVIGYAINSDGTCTYGTDCGDCTYSSDSSNSTSNSTSSTSTSTTTNSTSSSTKSTTSSKSTTGSASSTTTTTDTNGTSNTTTTTTTSSSSSSDNAGDAGTTATSSSNGLKTWQIALIICCGVLVFTVAVVSVLSCYCKARNRLYENEDDQADASYYQQQYPRQRQDVMGSGVPTPTLFSQAPTSARGHARSGSSGSFSSEYKPMYANPANSGSADRLGIGLAPVHMRNSSGDLAGMAAGSYPNERILSGSYSTDRRPSSSNRSIGRRPSLEQGYSTARDRDSLAVEL